MNPLSLNIKRSYQTINFLLVSSMILLFILSSQQVMAEIIQASANASPNSLSVTTNGRSQLSWRLSQRGSTGGAVTISSQEGIFYTISGDLLGRTVRPLQSSRVTQLRATTLFVLNESLDIPLSIIRSAQKSGSAQIIYQRTFIDSQDGNSRVASVIFQINSGSIASELAINRIQMEFDDGRKMGIFRNTSEFRATALISYQGTGLLEYSWEIASPPSTKGRPIYFPLISRKQYLLAGGQVTLQSPKLPSQLKGDYFVRLKIAQIDSRLKLPIIRYVINTTAQMGLNNRISKLIPSYPPVNALLMPSTEFKWKAVTNASAYQLEIHTKPLHNISPLDLEQELLITGVLIPANKTKLKVSEVSRSYLIPGKSYYWRVIAINDAGQVIAISEFRKIRF